VLISNRLKLYITLIIYSTEKMVAIQIGFLVVLLILSGFFSGVETALMSLNMVKVRALLAEKRNGAKALFRIKKNPHKLIITILIGNNVVNIAAASIATVLFTDIFGSRAIGYTTGIMTFLVLVFGEITPKTLAAQKAVGISLFVARPIEILSFILTPLIWIFEGMSRGVSRLLGAKKEKEVSDYSVRFSHLPILKTI